MINKIKIACRISHNKLDDDIADSISFARSEMIRLGIKQELANAETPDADILEAIKTYCKSVYSADKDMAEKYRLSWEYQLDCLRKTESRREKGV
ncbi:MAG: DNA-packaging protein [Clostridia bacterium]|nr:DNA-packaging protein [Clostridia bacterium]MBQ7093786.1 DNA-packaging protein [Clostridia bacterium]